MALKVETDSIHIQSIFKSHSTKQRHIQFLFKIEFLSEKKLNIKLSLHGQVKLYTIQYTSKSDLTK